MRRSCGVASVGTFFAAIRPPTTDRTHPPARHAWMFRRATRYDTAYVGSSNLSRAALLDGVEWNVRLSRVATPSLLEKVHATFDTYWNDASFELYDPDRDRDRLDDAIAEASGRRQNHATSVVLTHRLGHVGRTRPRDLVAATAPCGAG